MSQSTEQEEATAHEPVAFALLFGVESADPVCPASESHYGICGGSTDFYRLERF